jgi:translation initiation factor 3 subunit J
VTAGPKKKQLLVDKPDDDGYAPGTYDGVDDYDFM